MAKYSNFLLNLKTNHYNKSLDLIKQAYNYSKQNHIETIVTYSKTTSYDHYNNKV